MPYKSESIRLTETQDRRRKLTSQQYEEIRDLYASGIYSQTTIAKMYGISRSTVGFIINPDRAAAMQQYRKDNWRKYKQTKEEHAAAVRNTRQYKHKLYLKGELKGE